MIISTPQGLVIDVRVIPRARRAGVAGTRQGAFLVRLKAPPVGGAANAELVECIAKALGVPERAVTIIAGARNRVKKVRLEGVTPEAVRAAFNMPDEHTT